MLKDSEEFYNRLEKQLLESSSWPSVYIYKFILKSEENSNIISWFLSGGLPLLAFMITLFLAIGILYSLNRRKELAKDLEMIESWSTFDPRELDDEFNE